MKKIIFVFISVVFGQMMNAQWDDKFYHPEKNWVPVENISFEEIFLINDSDTIHSLLLQPEKTVKATILYFHGNGSNVSKWINHLRPLVEDGFQVCMMDYRGYGKSTGKPTHLNIAEDAQLLMDTLWSREDIRQMPLIIYGVSIGTQVATLLASNNNDKLSGLVLDGMMASFTDVAVATSPEAMREYVAKYVKSPYSAKESISSIQNVKLLVIHSEEDVIPIEGAREVYEKAKCPKTFWLYEGKHVEAPVKYPDMLVKYINQLL